MRQNIWIVRYGKTKFESIENEGPFDSPLDPHDGIEHAKAIARRIRNDILMESSPSSMSLSSSYSSYSSSSSSSSSSCMVASPVHVYSSPFIRATHTAQLIAIDLPFSSSTVRIEEGLTEWQQPSLLVNRRSGQRTIPKSPQQLATTYGTIDLDYQSLNPFPSSSGIVDVRDVHDDRHHDQYDHTNKESRSDTPDKNTNSNKGSDDSDRQDASLSSSTIPSYQDKPEEEEQDLLKRCSNTLERILEFVHTDSFVLVSHAACDQALALHLLPTSSKQQPSLVQGSLLDPWPLGGITKFSRPIYENGVCGKWEMECYGDTSHMPGKYKPGIKVCTLNRIM